MKVGTTGIEKGGTGKTTVTYNFGCYSADKKNLKTLLIDIDKSQNLTTRFEKQLRQYTLKPENTVNNLFRDREVEPLNVRHNIDILIAGEGLGDVQDEIKGEPNSHLILFSWIVKNYKALNEKYDLIWIDTHNDHGLLTKNAWAVSDLVLGVTDPSKDGFVAIIKQGKAINELKSKLVNVVTGEELMVAKYEFIGNKVKYNTKSSREFKSTVKDVKNYMGFIPDRELMNITSLEMQPISDLASEHNIYRDNKEFIENLYSLFDEILEKVGIGE